jgi:threonine dehydrogenase-like Zn-dependent dehydrogenase
VEEVPDPKLEQSAGALARVLRPCACGFGLCHCLSMPAAGHGPRDGHEFLGTAEDTGARVSTLKPGDVVVAQRR